MTPADGRGLEGGPAHARQAPNLYAKLSGLGTFVHRNDPALIALIYDAAIDILGSDRLMFGSNFPIEKLWTSHADLYRRPPRGRGQRMAQADRENIFWNTAAASTGRRRGCGSRGVSLRCGDRSRRANPPLP